MAVFHRRTKFDQIKSHEGNDEGKVRIETQPKPHILKFWLLELIFLILATAIIISIAFILSSYNGRPLPDWPHAISINTLLSVLSTAFRACLLAVVSSIIGQAKWVWLRQGSRPIHDLQVFDRATRGLIGSVLIIKLLAKRLLRSMIPLCAVIVDILSIAIGPFVQQAVKTVICDKPGHFGEASLPVAQKLPGYDSFIRIGDEMWEPGDGLKSAFINSLTPPGRRNSALQFQCTTEHVSIHTDEDDIHHYTLGTLQVDPVTSGNGTKLAVGAIHNATLPSDFVKLGKSSAATLSVLSLLGGLGIDPYFAAATCSLYFCKQDIEAVVDQGQLKETVISSTLVPTVNEYNTESSYDNHLLAKSPCLVNGNVYTATNFSALKNSTSERIFTPLMVNDKVVDVPPECIYSVEAYYIASITQWLERVFFDGRCREFDSARSDRVSCDQKFWLANLHDARNITFAYQQQTFTDLAASVTNFLRSDGFAPGTANSPIKGIATEKTACLELHWPWLLHSVIMCFITAVLFILTLLSSGRHSESMPVWKSSLLPLLCSDNKPGTEAPHERVLRTRYQNLDELGEIAKATGISIAANIDDMELVSVTVHDNVPGFKEEQDSSTDVLVVPEHANSEFAQPTSQLYAPTLSA